jgi:hypothetical protein
MHARVIAFACAWLLACGEERPEPVEPIELAENCGQTEPIRLLQYAPWRKVDFAWHLGVFGDRRLLAVHYDDSAAAPQVLYSVGLCGEAPRQLLSGRLWLWTPPGQEWPFACEPDSGELHVIDPSGERAPKLIARLPSCHLLWSEEGIFTIRGDTEESVTGDLLGYWWPDDIWSDELAPVIIADDVKTVWATPHQTVWDVLQGSYDELFFVTTNDELTRMNLDDGQLEVVATDVRAFTLGNEPDDSELGHWPRYVLWQDIELSNDDVENPEGEILLLDRTTNEVRSLGNSALGADLRATDWSTSGIVQLLVHVEDELVLRLFQLPSLSHVDVPASIEPRYMLADDRHLIVRFGEQGPIGTLDVQTGETVNFTSYFADHGSSYWWQQRAYALLPAAGGGKSYAEGELWLIDGGDPPELFANRATLVHGFMPDGRLITGVNLDPVAIGDLIVVDDFEERLIAQDVLTSQVSVGPNVGEDMLTYSILQGERAGLWLARLPPR